MHTLTDILPTPRIIDLFRKFDVNKDGTLSHQEFMDGILQTGIPTPRSCFPMIIREFDRDDSGDINYREFAAALKRYEVCVIIWAAEKSNIMFSSVNQPVVLNWDVGLS